MNKLWFYLLHHFSYVLAGLMLLILPGLRLQAASFSTAVLQNMCRNGLLSETQVAAYRGVSLDTMHLLMTRQSLAPADVCVIPQDDLDEAVDEATNPEPDEAGEAQDFRNLSLQDENGSIPADGLLKGKAQIDSMLANQRLSSDGAGVSRSSWTSLGPGNVGGRVRAIVVHPTDANTLWAASVSGGIWKTTDAGASWHILDDFMTSMAVSTLVIDPTNPAVLYAGTGEGFYNEDGIQGAGVFKTGDGGATWSQLAATNTPDWYFVNRLAISPDGSTMLAATKSGIWRSVNGGATWSHPSYGNVLDVSFSPSDSRKAIASLCNGKAFYSQDGGQTWTAATFTPALSGAGRIEVAYAGAGSSSTVYASIDVHSGEVWKSTNGGASYSLVNTGNCFLGGQGWYANAIWVDPTDANKLVVGGVDLWRSTDGGATLTAISEWWSAPQASAHADQHIIVQSSGFNGGSNKTLYFGNDGGIYRAGNYSTVARSTGWTNLNNNLGITQFYGVAANAATGNVIGGTQDNGTLFYSPAAGAQGWTTTFGGDGGFSAADPTNANIYYGEYTYLNLHRSTDAGASADYISGQVWNGSDWVWKAAPYRIDDAMNKAANFVAPFVLDPNNANHLLAGGASLWRTNDARTPNTATKGPAWTAIKPPLSSHTSISAIAVATGNSNIVWVGYSNGEVWKTANGTAPMPAWTRVGVGSPSLPGRFATRITIDRDQSSIVYVTFGGFTSSNVWRTANAGLTWTDISGTGLTGLPSLPVRTLAINPSNSQWLYAGTELGIFTSIDGGRSWSVDQDGPTNTSVEDMVWMNSTLVAATHGRGMFKTATAAASLTISGSTGVAGTVLRYKDGSPKTVTSDASGHYSLKVCYNWTGTVTASKPGFVFSPASKVYGKLLANVAAQDYTIVPLMSASNYSAAAQDGWLLESTESSLKGGTLNAATATFNVGDDAGNRQYRAFLSFNTSAVPDNAVIQSAVLKIKQSGAPAGVNPFNVLGNLLVDVRKPFFGAAGTLQLGDFNAAPSAAKVGTFNKNSLQWLV